MINSIRSEFRKLLTVRSTYFILLISLGIIALFAGYGEGIKASTANLHDPNLLVSESYNAIVFAGFILALAGLLLFGHEYRYNGIMYTLTTSNNRLKSLSAKVFVVSIFAVVVSLLCATFSPLATLIGQHLTHKELVPQVFPVWTVLWHAVFVGWGYAMYAFVIIALVRSQIGAIVAFLLIPLIGENILANIFHSAPKYLPFMSLQNVVTLPGSHITTSLAHNITVALVYIIGGLLVSAVLFTRRDAN